MDETNFPVALLTPASDLVTGDTDAEFEGVFGRAGNDTIYAYDPGVRNGKDQNIDFLFGDIFDNSEEEFEIILNLQDENGNPLLILDKDIPSVGRDRFILGDAIQPYYIDEGNPIDLLTSNQLGLKEFAVIYDFDPDQDIIQLNGKRKDYVIVEVDNLEVDSIQQPFFGEAIFSLQNGAPDLVAYVLSPPEVDLELKDKYFQFVGEKPPKKPDEKKIGQLGTTGIDISFDAASDASGNVYITGSTSGSLQGPNQGFSDAWVAKFNSNGNQVLGKQIGTSASEGATSVVTDDEGNFYVAGDTGGNLFSTKRSDGRDAWVAKYDSDGNLVWGRQLGANVTGGESNSAFGLQVNEQGDVYLSGLAIKENQNRDIFDFNVEDDSWVAKFDSNGNRQWFTEFDTFFFNESYDLTIDAEGNAYTVGWTQGLVKEADPSRNLLKYDAWIAKVDPGGQVEWIQQLGSTDEGLEFAWAVDTDSQGNIYATGWTTGELGTRNKESEKSESYDIWLAKFDPANGESQWVKQIGTKGDDGAFYADLEIDDQDNIFLAGYSNKKLEDKPGKIGNYDAWVGKFDTQGNNQWTQEFGSKKNLEYATGITASGDRLYVTGFTEAFLGSNGTGANGSAVDAWIAQLDTKKGKVQEFIGESEGEISFGGSGDTPIEDVTDEFVTDGELPSGDNRIDLTEGTDTDISVVDLGGVVSNLSDIFDSDAPNSFSSDLIEETIGDFF